MIIINQCSCKSNPASQKCVKIETHLLLCRERGERSEVDLCSEKQLSMSTLRMVYEAKTQLRDILLSCDFDEGKHG